MLNKVKGLEKQRDFFKNSSDENRKRLNAIIEEKFKAQKDKDMRE